jgi:hypothetical protein
MFELDIIRIISVVSFLVITELLFMLCAKSCKHEIDFLDAFVTKIGFGLLAFIPSAIILMILNVLISIDWKKLSETVISFGYIIIPAFLIIGFLLAWIFANQFIANKFIIKTGSGNTTGFCFFIS